MVLVLVFVRCTVRDFPDVIIMHESSRRDMDPPRESGVTLYLTGRNRAAVAAVATDVVVPVALAVVCHVGMAGVKRLSEGIKCQHTDGKKDGDKDNLFHPVHQIAFTEILLISGSNLVAGTRTAKVPHPSVMNN